MAALEAPYNRTHVCSTYSRGNRCARQELTQTLLSITCTKTVTMPKKNAITAAVYKQNHALPPVVSIEETPQTQCYREMSMLSYFQQR